MHGIHWKITFVADSEELFVNSGPLLETLIEIGNDHPLADPEPLMALLEAVEKMAHGTK